jgi:hypothetical protein
VCDDRPWTLTAPWWAWPKTGTAGRDPRATAPLLQKYDSSDPVSGFVKEPQKRLAFVAEDIVQHTVAHPAVAGKKARLSDYKLVPDPNGTRKLYLPSHKRFYLVVCELHCDSPGLPAVTRDKVCEAGFVVRRRRLSVPEERKAEAAALVQQIGALAGQIAALDRGGPGRLLKKRGRMTAGGVFGAMAGPASAPPVSKVATVVDAKQAARRAELEGELAASRAALVKWKAESGTVSVAEGWIADADAENVGAWAVVDDRPAAIEETVYRLTPLVADPRTPAHDAAGKTLWFGMVPAGSRQVEANGTARFDDATRYEVRCFVRRHACDCPKTGEPNDCGGELVWSAATPVFQLAPHFDPVGTGNQPVTIQMPDIRTLAASVGARLPVQMKFPAGSALNIQGDKEGKPKNPSTNGDFPQICFFSIPLITIIASFVLNLFLPVVVFLFGLWFLLGLKFCILPSITLGGGANLTAHADLDLKIDLAISGKLDVQINADAVLGGNLGADFNLLALGEAQSSGSVGTNRAPNPGTPGYEFINGTATQPAYANTAVLEVQQAMSDDRSAEVAAIDVRPSQWEPRVERWEVGA